ncbi:MAG: ankyrin repeat domain-containing protein, partial [Acidobacteria bacterium]|nr:ankyrin repeat domain-containing protein [Acidobacteriota bacterium]
MVRWLAPLLFILAAFATASELHTAVRSGDLARARAAIAAGAAVNERDQLGATPLHDAAWSGDVAMASLLLDHGAVVDARHTDSGSTPLHYAVITNHLEVARL